MSQPIPAARSPVMAAVRSTRLAAVSACGCTGRGRKLCDHGGGVGGEQHLDSSHRGGGAVPPGLRVVGIQDQVADQPPPPKICRPRPYPNRTLTVVAQVTAQPQMRRRVE